MVRDVSSNARVRVMATNLDPADFPWECFGELYHKRWRIKKAFKWRKYHMQLETVSGLSQHALIIDVASKVLADNLAKDVLPYHCGSLQSTTEKSRQTSRAVCIQGIAWLKFGALDPPLTADHML